MASFEVLKSQYGCGENHKIKRHDDVGRRFQFIFPFRLDLSEVELEFFSLKNISDRSATLSRYGGD